MKRKATGRDS